MPVRLRLARHGQKNTPYYHLVAINARSRRNAQPIEKLGEYDPIARVPIHNSPFASTSPITAVMPSEVPSTLPKEKKIVWNTERIKWWLDNGAQPTASVVGLLEKGGVLKGHHQWRQWQEKKAKKQPGSDA